MDGYEGGRANIRVKYANGAGLTRVRLVVNSVDWSLINLIATESDDDFSGDANFTAPLKPGKTNTIHLVAFDGDAKIESITITPLD